MRNYLVVALTLFMLLAGGIASSQASAPPGGTLNPPDPFVFQFDENGHGAGSNNGGPFVPSIGFAAMDPNTGVMALTYALPAGPVGSGIVGITEPSDSSIQDAISFYNIGNAAFMAYYSDNSDGLGTDQADTISGGFVPFATFTVPEVGPEGNNGFAYFSGGTQGANNDYFGISDTPEPASLTLIGIGAASMAGFCLRRRKKIAS